MDVCVYSYVSVVMCPYPWQGLLVLSPPLFNLIGFASFVYFVNLFKDRLFTFCIFRMLFLWPDTLFLRSSPDWILLLCQVTERHHFLWEAFVAPQTVIEPLWHSPLPLLFFFFLFKTSYVVISRALSLSLALALIIIIFLGLVVLLEVLWKQELALSCPPTAISLMSVTVLGI